MQYKQIQVSSLVNRFTHKDMLFSGVYSIDPYQNCEFGCLYCDSSFDKTIYIKSNAAEIFEKEINNLENGRIIVGSVHDPYQNAEKQYMLTRSLLKIIKEYGFPCHILTKSDLVIRDLDVVSSMDQCYITISLSSLNPNVYNVFEKYVQYPEIRLDIVKKLVENGVQSGIAIIPVIPYLIDDELEDVIVLARKQKAQYILLKHLELKGDQKYCFMEILQKNFPDIVEKFQKLYESSYMPDESYISTLNNIFKKLCRKHNIKNKI